LSAPRGEGLESLPAHFHRERAVLREAGVCTWRRLAEVSPERLRELARPGAASEARLLRLRAQASLMVAADLAPEHASLLLHAGIAEPRALAEADLPGGRAGLDPGGESLGELTPVGQSRWPAVNGMEILLAMGIVFW